jgi:protein-disulfide isomerase
MHDRIFANQQAMDVDALKQHAAALGLNTATFNECLDSGKFGDVVAQDLRYAQKLGVQSTPSFFINGRALVGAQPFEAFQAIIDEELAMTRR